MVHPIDSSNKIAVFGAGLVGSLLAIMLSRKGFKVEVHEKRPDLRYKSYANLRSINLALSQRGWQALEEVGLGEPLKAIALPMYGRAVHDKSGNEHFYPYGYENQAIYSISRHKLNCFLLDEAEKDPNVRFYFESKAEKFAFDRSLGYVADIEGLRHRIEADAFFGTDGAFSALRYEMMREDKFLYQQHYIEHGYKELTLLPNKEGDFALRPDALHIWPRKSFMMIALPNSDKTFTCTLFYAFEGEQSFERLQTDQEIRNFFEEEFPDLARLMPDHVLQFKTHPVASLVTIQCAPWNNRNFLLLGDAAHAIVPFYGQGMNAGFEDCRLLMAQLEEAGNWEDLFKNFYSRRKADADAISTLALENFIEMRDLVSDPEFQLRKELETVVIQAGIHDWIPLYTMVSFTDIPYSVALKKGRQQAEVLEQLRRLEDWRSLPKEAWKEKISVHMDLLWPV